MTEEDEKEETEGTKRVLESLLNVADLPENKDSKDLNITEVEKESWVEWPKGKKTAIRWKEMGAGRHDQIVDEAFLACSGDLPRMERLLQTRILKEAILSIGSKSMLPKNAYDTTPFPLIEAIRRAIFGTTGIPGLEELMLKNLVTQSLLSITSTETGSDKTDSSHPRE